ncbi:SAM-dependent methyltransferase [Lentzea sp. HUAS12]|uniref:SAM-dependent methyltransferase n=1 Tax=Lentzea sp. HUAS12 TaxID=2951806 RepID=UPI00209DBBC8|nr:SAM-dependent methyltransferase [Lentzea sp. HUAS12]USX55532.1 SAM-dependent methyltransferase [Lentzea sp. HUAS12]
MDGSSPRTLRSSVVVPLSSLEVGFFEDAMLMMLRRGIRQFLDVGSRAPEKNGVHSLASYLYPESVVVRVGDGLFPGGRRREPPTASIGSVHLLRARVTEVDEALAECFTARWLDRERPVGVIAVGAADRNAPWSSPAPMMARCNALLGAESMVAATRRLLGPWGTGRAGSTDIEELSEMFDGLDLVKPGLVRLPHCWPGSAGRAWAHSAVSDQGVLAGIALKPAGRASFHSR